MGRYFQKYDIINYNGLYAVNLMNRAQLSQDTLDNVQLFYPYQVKEEEMRTDIISAKYYKDPFYDWIVNLSNQVVDPYYDYAIDDLSFANFIATKYGSMQQAQATTMYYQNNWASDDSIITVSAYEALGNSLKKYWTATLNYLGQVSGYSRKQEDWIVSTNAIVQITTPNTAPLIGSLYTDSNTGGTGTICYTDPLVTQIQHITGTFSNSTILTETVAYTEGSYWDPVDAYSYEVNLNETKRSIKLIDNRYVFDIEQELAQALAQ